MSAQPSIRSTLYEAPGPRARRRIAAATVCSVAALAALLAFVVHRFYITGQLAPRHWSFFLRPTTWLFLGRGLLGTLEAAAVAGVLAFAMGFGMMLGRLHRSPLVRGCSRVLIEFSRGVPTLLFIYFFFLVVPQLGIRLPALWKISLPVAISAAGVVAEMLRSGVNAVPRGQQEAALSLGMTERSVFYRVILPQALHYVVPGLISELVIVVKDTTFAYIVNFPDVMQHARVLISNYDSMLSVYLFVAVVYILINYLLNQASLLAERRRRVPGGNRR